jgi:hypothetical protein
MGEGFQMMVPYIQKYKYVSHIDWGEIKNACLSIICLLSFWSNKFFLFKITFNLQEKISIQKFIEISPYFVKVLEFDYEFFWSFYVPQNLIVLETSSEANRLHDK